MQAKRNPGIRVRHAGTCPARADRDARCKCKPSYEAFVYSPRDGRKLRKTFHTLSEARGWRADATSAVRKRTLRAPAQTTLREAADAWLDGARHGSIRNRSGDAYKPSAISGYESALRLRILPELGSAKLAAVSHRDLQDLADRLLANGADPSTIRNALMPLRAIYRRALARGDVAVNPTTGLALPAVRGKRDRIADPAEAAALLDALSEHDRPLWATALYAGLRRGELMALRWGDVDLAAGLIRVERNYDPKAGEYVEPKSRAGKRRVPIASVLRGYLVAHELRSTTSADASALVFGRTATSPFDDERKNAHARKAWARRFQCGCDLDPEAEPALDGNGAPVCREHREPTLDPIGLHEARHTFASLMIAAGVNAKSLSTYLGHASISITLDRYGHLMPGNEGEAAGLLDAYLARSTEATS